MELHVPPELEAKLNRLAADTGRSAEQLALDLLASSVEHDEWFRREVEKGRLSAREGRLLDRNELHRVQISSENDAVLLRGLRWTPVLAVS